MKKQLCSTLILCGLFASVLHAQSGARYLKNTLYGSLLGDGAAISLQYDRVVFAKNQLFIDVKAGVGAPSRIDILGYEQKRSTDVSFPHSISLNFGRRHALEIGVGGNLTVADQHNEYVVYPTVGYKFRAERKRFSFRAFIHPIVPKTQYSGYFLPVGLSLGYSF